MNLSPRSCTVISVLVVCVRVPSAVGGETACAYDSATRTLVVKTAAKRSFKYAFNPGGAVSGLFDLDLAADTNLVGDSYQGETTDRVIQWTYWNSRYLADPHESGDRDRRANVTMEGCFGGKHLCEVLDSPKTGHTRTLTFRSRITHWFYSELDRNGRPDFETTSRYEVLDDGSLRLDRAVIRRPWKLRDVVVRTWENGQWRETKSNEVLLKAEHLGPGSMTSYFEAWTPLRRTALPYQRHGKGTFDKDGYRLWDPDSLGGWAMAYSESQAVAIVFGSAQAKESTNKTRLVFNKLDLPGHKLNVLLPGVETTWPDYATLRHTIILVMGDPRDVTERANKLSPTIPCATVSAE